MREQSREFSSSDLPWLILYLGLWWNALEWVRSLSPPHPYVWNPETITEYVLAVMIVSLEIFLMFWVLGILKSALMFLTRLYRGDKKQAGAV